MVETHLIQQRKIKGNMYRKLLLMVVLLVLTNHLTAQNHLEYAFPEKVMNEINKYVNKQLSNNPKQTFYALLRSKNQNNEYTIYISEYTSGSNEKEDFLIANTNRLIHLDALKVPVILSEDFNFVAHGYGKRGDKTVPIRLHIICEGFYIRFSKTGKVIETGW